MRFGTGLIGWGKSLKKAICRQPTFGRCGSRVEPLWGELRIQLGYRQPSQRYSTPERLIKFCEMLSLKVL